MSQYSFNAEIPKLMNMIIHNFYSSKEIFIRELISNSSDALDKLKYNSLTNPQYLDLNKEFVIKIYANKDLKTLVIEDTGIGMTENDLINCLGTIAKSGTEEFVKQILQNKSSENPNLIGQFGVGFYSSFLVADKVQVYSKHPDSSSVLCWESDAKTGYSITSIENYDLVRGTRIILYINSEQLEFLEENNLGDIIKKHSGYVGYPIMLMKRKKITKEEVVDEQVVDEQVVKEEVVDEQVVKDEESLVKVEDNYDSDSDKKKLIEDKDEYENIYEIINTEPTWIKNPSEVTQEEYTNFYKSLTNEKDTYQAVKHYKAEGNLEFSSILYIPKKSPFDMFEQSKNKNNIKLYVKKVLITDNCTDLYPEYFNFVRGVVDSYDLPLNASRELLQESKIIKSMNKSLVKKTIEMISELAENEVEYMDFYKNCSKNIKLAINEDKNNREKLLDFVRYTTSKSDDKEIKLKTYIDRMTESQPGIYYITGDTLLNVKNSPFIDKLKEKNYEIIYMIDTLDEYIMQHIKEYLNKPFINVVKDDLKIDNETVNNENTNNEICKRIKDVLGDLVNNVSISTKIVNQPGIISSPMGISAGMERIMKTQSVNDEMLSYMIGKKILEINPTHRIIQKIIETNYDKNYVFAVFEMACLAGGYQLDNINGFLTRIYELI